MEPGSCECPGKGGQHNKCPGKRDGEGSVSTHLIQTNSGENAIIPVSTKALNRIFFYHSIISIMK